MAAAVKLERRRLVQATADAFGDKLYQLTVACRQGDRRACDEVAHTQSEIGDKLYHLNLACQQADRSACVEFGMLLGQSRDRAEEWRRDHT